MLKKEDIKDIIKLKDKEKLTYKEIADKINASPSTIFYRYKLGKERYPEIFKENSKNIQNISKENLENPKNSLEKSDNPIPGIVKKVKNPPGNWRQKKESAVAIGESGKSLEDNSLKKGSNSLKQKGVISEQKEGENKRGAIKVKHNGNLLFFVIIAGIIALVTYMIIKEFKNEGGGGQKTKEPQPQSQPPVSTVEPGREWTRE